MLYQPEHALLVAVGFALAFPWPRRFHPFALTGYAARVFARDLPNRGRWAVPAGALLLLLISGLAIAIAWLLTYVLPTGLQISAPEAAPLIALVLAGVVLRWTLWLAPLWDWLRWIRMERASPQGRGSHNAPTDLLTRCGVEFVAPVLIFAFLGIYAAVMYRIALEITRTLVESDWLSLPAATLAYLPAVPAQRLAILFCVRAGGCGPDGLCVRRPARGLGAAVVAVTALALVIMIW